VAASQRGVPGDDRARIPVPKIKKAAEKPLGAEIPHSYLRSTVAQEVRKFKRHFAEYRCRAFGAQHAVPLRGIGNNM